MHCCAFRDMETATESTSTEEALIRLKSSSCDAIPIVDKQGNLVRLWTRIPHCSCSLTP